ncbi:MAG: metalloregulator ArsR/SmtB family transcription factor [Candidatus Sericytochromatia bacterium]|nr:metalloregulator ArsR/SmtB family transcription factor [Candidatus Sericytochromatia bacterium]
MPHRRIAARELGELFGVLSHPERLQIVEELRQGELDVASLQGILGISHAKTSRQLAILRAQKLVAERQEGRHVYYRLTDRTLALWVAQGLRFIETSRFTSDEIREAARMSAAHWLEQAPDQTPGA